MRRSLEIVVLAVMIAGCSKSLDSRSKTFTYPMQLGDRWTYEYTFFQQGTATTLPVDTQFVSTLDVLVEKVDTVPPGVAAYTARAIEVGSDTNGAITRRTYINLSEGLYLLSQQATASNRLSYVLMRPFIGNARPTTIPTCLNATVAIGLAAAPGDPMIPNGQPTAGNPDTLPLVLAYPQHNGLFWRDHDSGAVWAYTLDKHIEGREIVTTRAGSFDCWRIRCTYGAPYTSYKELEYVSDQGLIRRRVEVALFGGRAILIYELVSITLR